MNKFMQAIKDVKDFILGKPKAFVNVKKTASSKKPKRKYTKRKK